MTPLMVDASIVVKWLLPEPHSIPARRVLTKRNDLLAPDLLWAELGNVLWKKSRAGELTTEEACDLLQDLRRFPIRTLPSFGLIAPALDIATRFGRSVYDCLHVAMAISRRCRVATSHRHLYASLSKSPLAPCLLWVEDVQ